jgi:hypothetical protein
MDANNPLLCFEGGIIAVYVVKYFAVPAPRALFKLKIQLLEVVSDVSKNGISHNSATRRRMERLCNCSHRHPWQIQIFCTAAWTNHNSSNSHHQHLDRAPKPMLRNWWQGYNLPERRLPI